MRLIIVLGLSTLLLGLAIWWHGAARISYVIKANTEALLYTPASEITLPLPAVSWYHDSRSTAELLGPGQLTIPAGAPLLFTRIARGELLIAPQCSSDTAAVDVGLYWPEEKENTVEKKVEYLMLSCKTRLAVPAAELEIQSPLVLYLTGEFVIPPYISSGVRMPMLREGTVFAVKHLRYGDIPLEPKPLMPYHSLRTSRGRPVDLLLFLNSDDPGLMVSGSLASELTIQPYRRAAPAAHPVGAPPLDSILKDPLVAILGIAIAIAASLVTIWPWLED